ncbi:MAG: cysteine desulfurase [Clostridia bacterium]|nr:cysteine desulfurase [Clostridia bacterium]
MGGQVNLQAALTGEKRQNLDIQKIRNDFPILSKSFNDKNLIYFDNAATTQKPKKVLDAIVDYYSNENCNVGRGVYTLSIKANMAFGRARETVQKFLNAEHTEEIIYTRGTTEAINLVASTLGRALVGQGDEVIISEMEHHSNLIPWQILCKEKDAVLKVIPVNDDGDIDFDAYKNMLNEKTKIVAVTHISNVLGTVNPLKEIISEAHQYGIPVIIDGAQGIAHEKVDVQALDCDFYCFSGHKMYGPMGIGVMYGKKKFLEKMPYYQTGGGIALGVTYQDITVERPLPFKLEAGTPNVEGAIGLEAAIQYLTEIGYDDIIAHENELLDYARKKLSDIEGMRIFGSAKKTSSIISFLIGDIHPYDVGNKANEFGIALRTGVHCAIPFVDKMKIVGTVRASFGIYNTKEEVDALYQALLQVKKAEWSVNRPKDRF